MCLSWWKVPYGGKNSLHAEGLRYLSAFSYPTTLVLQKNDGRESCSSQYEYKWVNLQTPLLVSPKGLSCSSTRLPPSFAQQPHVNWAQSQASTQIWGGNTDESRMNKSLTGSGVNTLLIRCLTSCSWGNVPLKILEVATSDAFPGAHISDSPNPRAWLPMGLSCQSRTGHVATYF